MSDPSNSPSSSASEPALPTDASTSSITNPNWYNPNAAAPWLVGALLSSFEYGALVILVMTYFLRYRNKDQLWIRAIVISLTILSSFHWSVDFYILWKYFLAPRTITVQDPTWAFPVAPHVFSIPVTIMPLSCVLSQIFFSWRSYELSARKKWVAWLFGSLILITLGVGIGLMVVTMAREYPFLNGKDVKDFSLASNNVEKAYLLAVHFLEAFLAMSAFTDILITLVLVLFLLPSRQGFNPRTDTLISRILYLSVTTGFISSASVLADVFLVVGTVKDTNDHIAMCLEQPHVYALVTVATLNLRKVIDPYGRPNQDGVSVTNKTGSSTASNSGIRRNTHVWRGQSDSGFEEERKSVAYQSTRMGKMGDPNHKDQCFQQTPKAVDGDNFFVTVQTERHIEEYGNSHSNLSPV